jgi:hypothetical protein
VELIAGLAILILFDIAAWRWGVDSRVGIEDGHSFGPVSRRWI